MGTPVADTTLVRGTFLRMLDTGLAYVKVDQRVGTAANVQAIVAINASIAAGSRVWLVSYYTTSQVYVIIGADTFASQAVPIPVGAIIAWTDGTLETAPEGFLLCDFAEVSRDGYSALYGVLGDLYGVG